jgi:hypothetical protein
VIVVVNLPMGVHGQRDGAGLVELAECALLLQLVEVCSQLLV